MWLQLSSAAHNFADDGSCLKRMNDEQQHLVEARTQWGQTAKGGFYSEGADAFVISSNRQTLLFS